MTPSTKAFFFVVLVAAACSTGQCQLFNTSIASLVGELPAPIVSNLLTILTSEAVQLTGNCSNSNEAPLTKFYLFTRQYPNGIQIDSLDQIDSTKPIKIVIHGWGGNYTIDYIIVIINAYLQVDDYNVISVDYSQYANDDYQTAYCHVPAIAFVVANFTCQLATRVDISSIHVVGHSLGGQVAGIAGNQTQVQCNGKIGRITGLDPAGPLYQDISPYYRLSISSAVIVDVIHTNQGQFGYIGDVGSVDYFPNCGFLQPGCIEYVIGNLTIENIGDLPLSFIDCNHQRSCYLFASSILNNNFYTTNCIACGTPVCSAELSVLNPSHSYMGEYCCNPPPVDQEYYCTTTADPPYSEGATGASR